MMQACLLDSSELNTYSAEMKSTQSRSRKRGGRKPRNGSAIISTSHSTGNAFRPAQARVLDAALALFSEYGVNGTSLQMIADTIGVTKAAVYHQFQAKEDIVLAIGGIVFDRLDELMDIAESQTSRQKVCEVLIEELIELAVLRRRTASFLHQDPIMLRLIDEHIPFRRVMERLDKLLIGENTSAEARVTAAMLITAIGGAVMHPLVANVDDDALRTQLGRVAHGLLKYLK